MATQVTGRPHALPDDLRGWVELRVYGGVSQQEIVDALRLHFQVVVAVSTLKQRLAEWGLQQRQSRPPAVVTPVLITRITHAFHYLRLTDKEIARMLEIDGYVIGPRRVARIRKQLGLFKRYAVHERAAMEAYMEEKLKHELDEGKMNRYGRKMLYTYMRGKYNMVGRDRLYKVLEVLNPDGVQERRIRRRQHATSLRTTGPNQVWSMDAYCKLEFWGFQIYAIIDHWSRYIVALYVGITARTQVSVLAQYMKVVEAGGIIPHILQSDRGSETRIVADAHLSLRRHTHIGEEPLTFVEAFLFGTSKMNQRIEAWWAQQCSSTGPWREYFQELSNQGDYAKHKKSDRVAMLFVYMPIIRELLLDFVHLWNTHRIRKQADKPHVIGGIPFMMHYYPEEHGEEFAQQGIAIDLALLQPIQADIEALEFDLEEYLPEATLSWCAEACREWIEPGMAVSGSAVDANSDKIHPQVYKHLRNKLRTHFMVYGDASIEESEKPLADEHWRPNPVNERLREQAGELAFEGPPLVRW